jgi:DNA polymerase I-like protein with 3'-5' exonuclease and polymerase domains
MIIAFDTEVGGLDIFHGAKPYFVTTCTSEGKLKYWDWQDYFDPFTRNVYIPQKDIEEILNYIDSASLIVGQNILYDTIVCQQANIIPSWPWHKTVDLLYAAHLLASNHKKDLTALAVNYLGIDIAPLEDNLGKICNEARRYARTNYPLWKIVEDGMDDLPSAKSGKKLWKYDMWLPYALCKAEWEGCISEEDRNPDFDPKEGIKKKYWTALRDYGNGDSQVTVMLWPVMKEELLRRNLYRIYEERLKLLPIVQGMRNRGMSMSLENRKALVKRYKKEAKQSQQTCLNIAASYNYDLILPAGGSNHSLLDFCFGQPIDRKKLYLGYSQQYLNLPPVEFTEKTGSPSLNKAAMSHYLNTLDSNKRPGVFIKNFAKARERNTQLTFLRAYKRFALPTEDSNYTILHPNFNPVGTNTLRWSSDSPNAENVKKSDDKWESLRYCLCPLPGREWYSVDAQNIELRIPFYLSEEKTLIELFERAAEPPFYGSVHLLNFSIVFPEIWNYEIEQVGIEKVGPHCKKKYKSTQYQWTKNGGLGKQYGAGKKKTDTTFRRDGAYDLLDNTFSKLKKLTDECIAFAKKYGYVETLPDRSVDPTKGYPILCTRTEMGSILDTTPLNYKIQGTACWVLMRMAIEVQKLLDKWTLEDPRGYYMIANVHDELVFDFPYEPDGGNFWRIKKVKEVMDSIGNDLVPSIPLPVSIEYHKENWSEGQPI